MDLTRIRDAVVRSVCRTEPGRISRLTRVGEAVVRRIESEWESHLGSISSTVENRIPAARQSQIIHDCLRASSFLLSNARGVHYHPVSMDRATSLILDTLLILQDRQPPRRPHVCLGKNRHGGMCGRRVMRYRDRQSMHQQSLEVLITLRQPAGSYVVSGISMFRAIRRYNHPRLCWVHKEVLLTMLHKVIHRYC